MAKYKLLAGRFHDLGPVQKEAEGGTCTHPRARTYRQGEIIETDADLCKFNGPKPMRPKFQRVEDPKDLPELEAAQAEIEALQAELAEAKG